MVGDSDLVCVYTCQGWHVAQIYKSKLEAAGIPVLLKYEAAGLVFGLTVDGLGAVRVMVPQDYSDEAKALLEETPEPSSMEAHADIDDTLPDESDDLALSGPDQEDVT
jgi:hypothetical protein